MSNPIALKYNNPNETQYMKGGLIDSNAKYYYKDLTSNNFANRIKLNFENEPKLDFRSQIPTNQLTQTVVKEFPLTENAFSRADYESEVTNQISLHKYQTLLKKDNSLNKIVCKRNKSIKDNFKKEKEELRDELVRIIREALIFSKKNNFMISMLPDEIIKLKEDKRINMSLTSLNLSSMSKQSVRSIQKYESNIFLKELGLDLLNLSPDNIKIDIEKAFEFIHNWKTDRDIKEVIRYKLVNEIMSVAEKRASQRVEKINAKYKDIKKKKKEEKRRMKKQLEEALKKKDAEEDKFTKMRKRLNTSSKSGIKISGNNKKTKKLEIRSKTSSKGPLSRKKNDKYKEPVKTEPRAKKKLNSYNHVDNILKFISQSDNLTENTNICQHFLNIKNTKNLNEVKNRLIKKNRIESLITATEPNKFNN